MCDPPEEAAAAEGSEPKRPCHINIKAKALVEKILTTKPGGEHIMREYAKTKSLKDATRRQMINILAAEMTQTHGAKPAGKHSCRFLRRGRISRGSMATRASRLLLKPMQHAATLQPACVDNNDPERGRSRPALLLTNERTPLSPAQHTHTSKYNTIAE
ncbi:uncharacterized protein V6R79_010133 [Siganus canaliculatus]